MFSLRPSFVSSGIRDFSQDACKHEDHKVTPAFLTTQVSMKDASPWFHLQASENEEALTQFEKL